MPGVMKTCIAVVVLLVSLAGPIQGAPAPSRTVRLVTDKGVGMVRLTQGRRLSVQISVKPPPSYVGQAAIVLGTCARPTKTVAPLNNVVHGASTTTVGNLTLKGLTSNAYLLAVWTLGPGRKRVTHACGNISHPMVGGIGNRP
jgi:hypothetical protein